MKIRRVYREFVLNDFWFLPHDLVPFLSSFLYSSQSLISHLCFQMGYAKRPFFPTFELLPSQIFILPFTRPRDRGVKKDGRDLDLSIKDEQHFKCIKRGNECACSGMARCKP